MAEVFDCSDSSQALAGTRLARQAISRGELVVLPTDTVYGVAADAFSATAVQRLLDAKGRGRQSPPPVLIPNVGTLAALAAEASEPLRDLAAAFWPGALTIITQANPSLSWDLGETGGTVALRIPANDITRELLAETGPLAVSSANKTGVPAAGTAEEARDMLGDSVAVYLDGGEARGLASTIIDATKLATDGTGTVRVVRVGGVTLEALREVLPNAEVLEGAAPVRAQATASDSEAAAAYSPDASDAPPEAATEPLTGTTSADTASTPEEPPAEG